MVSKEQDILVARTDPARLMELASKYAPRSRQTVEEALQPSVVYLIVTDIDLGYTVVHATMSSDRAETLLQDERDKERARLIKDGLSDEKAREIADAYTYIEQVPLKR